MSPEEQVMNFAELSEQASQAATECSRRGDREGDFYARGLRDAYAVAAAFTVQVGRDAVKAGDSITWRTRNGGHLARGVVQWATSSAVHVAIPDRGIYAVEWDRVLTHEAA